MTARLPSNSGMAGFHSSARAHQAAQGEASCHWQDPHNKLAAATIPADKRPYQRQIEATDRQIDALVYELYGLMGEEIAVGEG